MPTRPYFPAYRHKDFQNVCKLYGLQRVVRLLNQVPPHQRDDFITSVLYESNQRALDPAGGCCTAISTLLTQIHHCSSQLDNVLALLDFVKSRSLNLQETDMTQHSPTDFSDELRTREILNRLFEDDE